MGYILLAHYLLGVIYNNFIKVLEMKHFRDTIRTAAVAIIISIAQTAYSTQIMDTYEGGSSVKSNGSSYGDVIGSTNDFQINYMDASLVGNILHVSIDTTFGGKGDNGLFSGSTYGGDGIGYGDLFLSSSWTPSGSAPYSLDDNTNGTIWTYGFSLDNRYAVENIEHDGTLYSLNSGNNNANALLSDDFLSANDFYYRNGQEVAVDKSSNVTAINRGTWDSTVNKVNFEIDLTGTTLLDGNNIALHWGMTCGNDIIEGQYTVPEPAILGLLALGLIGIGVSKRKNS